MGRYSRFTQLALFFTAAQALWQPACYCGQDAGPGAESVYSQVVETTNRRLEAEVKEANALVDSLSAEKAAAVLDTNRMRSERDDALAKLKALTAENARLKEESTALQQAVVDMDIKNKALKGSADSSPENGQIDRLREEFSAYKKKSDALAAKSEKLEKELAAARNREKTLDRPREELSALKEKFDSLQKELDRSKKQDADSGELKKKNEALLKDKEELLKKVRSLQDNLKDTVSDLAASNRLSAKLKRETADMHYNLGVLFQEGARWDEAIREYKKALETQPDDADSHYNLAIIYDTVKNDRDKAMAEYRRYLDIKPDASDADATKEYIVNLSTQDKIWGAPYAKGIKEKMGRW